MNTAVRVQFLPFLPGNLTFIGENVVFCSFLVPTGSFTDPKDLKFSVLQVTNVKVFYCVFSHIA